jgi:hypothetical protein
LSLIDQFQRLGDRPATRVYRNKASSRMLTSTHAPTGMVMDMAQQALHQVRTAASRFASWARSQPLNQARTAASRFVSLARNHPWPTGIAGAAVIALLVWALWPSSAPPPAPRARQYLTFTACLLTSQRGIADPKAAPIWAGMQDASLATRAKVQYLAVTGPQTVDNAVTFVNTLAQTHCNLIIAAGDIPDGAVQKAAPTFPTTAFYAVGTTIGTSHVRAIGGATDDAIRSNTNRLVSAAAASSRQS